MAKTKQDYIDAGYTSGRSGVKAEHFAKPDSWQAHAWMQGYQSGADDYATAGLKIAAECAMDTEMAEVAAFKKANPMVKTSGRPIPRAVIEHINCLQRAYVTTDVPRRARLTAKIEKLVSKWQRKALAGA